MNGGESIALDETNQQVVLPPGFHCDQYPRFVHENIGIQYDALYIQITN